jgi:DNA-binding NtrC family response regulator
MSRNRRPVLLLGETGLAQTSGDEASAASLMRIGRTTLYRKMAQYGIE